MMPLLETIKQIYLFDRAPMDAVELSFGGCAQALNHTGVVVVEHQSIGGPLVREFVYGPSSSRP
jgi:hypothetical protein